MSGWRSVRTDMAMAFINPMPLIGDGGPSERRDPHKDRKKTPSMLEVGRFQVPVEK